MTTQINYNKERGTIFSVLADGRFHTEVPEGTEGAVRREFETSDGKKGVKIELVAGSISGNITNIALYEGDYGKQIAISLGDTSKDDVTIYLSTQSAFGEDFMKKLPNLNLEKEIKFAPFSFEDDKGKSRKGMTLYQDDVKIEGHYHRKQGDVIVTQNGYPEVPADSKNYDSEDWKLYFGIARKFLVEEMKKNAMFNKAPQKQTSTRPKVGTTDIDYPAETISPDDIPF